MDVTLNAGENFSTAILPFDIGLSYHGGFNAPDFIFPPDLFFPPFFVDAPGLIGVKYLKSPVDPDTGLEVGLTLFSNTQNPSSPGAQFIDPLGDKQLWRYLSGRLDPAQGDPPCNVEASIITGDPRTTVRPLCFIFQQAADTRFFQASGPFSIGPGDVGTIVVAYIAAPTVASDEITTQADPNANPPGQPSFHPEFPSERGCDATGSNCIVSDPVNDVLPIERAAGWLTYINPPATIPGAIETADNKVDQRNVAVVPGSLLGRALVAQTVFDSKFLLGSAPEPPPFWLIPGDEKVTVIWNETPTELVGDPFYNAASDPENSLFNPNYREFDVEGYRVWRGVDPGTLELLAQFDKAGSAFTDNTCETVPPTKDFYAYGASDAGLGYAAGEPCPYVGAPFDVPINSDMLFNNGSDGGSPGGGVVRSAAGPAVGVSLTQVIVDDQSGQRVPATDTGIPFSFVDTDVANNFTYFYAVSAFDVNSQASGPHSLRSLRTAISTVPRASNSALQAGFEADVIISGDDGVALDLEGPQIAPDVDTGIFPGPQNPTNALSLAIEPPPAEVADILAPGQLTGVFDSVTAEDVSFGCASSGGNGLGACLVVHMTFDNGIETSSTSLEIARPVWDSFGEPATVEGPLGAGAYPFDGERLADFGIPPGAGAGVAAGLSGTFDMTISDPAFIGQRVRRFPTGRYQPGGNRWFDGTVNDTPDPTTFIRAGHIDGIDSVWAPIHHTEISSSNLTTYPASGQMQCFGYTLAILARSADYQVTWGAGGTVTVRDVTHNVPVDFKPTPQMSYGFLNTDGNGNGVIDWHDFDFLDVIQQATNITNTFCEGAPGATTALEQSATIQPVSLDGTNPSAGPMASAGNGFAMYINGERYIFLTDALPAEGTVWTYRTYNGRIRATPGLSDDPGEYELRGGSGSNRSPAIPNMVFTLDVVEAGISQVGDFNLSEVHAVPDPYLSTSQYDLSPTSKNISFVNLPPRATIRVYTLTGVLVDVIDHNDPTGGGRARWGLRNRNNQFIASGVYFFHVVTPDKDEYVGKFTVVNFAGQN
jgi:hypothetical protein